MARHPKNRSDETFELNDGPVVRIAHGASFAVMICVALLIGWMVSTPVDEIAKARGAVEPISEVQRIQSEFGGALTSVAVRKGDLVSEGDLIAVFDRTEFTSQLREARIADFALTLERERLSAIVEKRDPDFGPIRDVFLTYLDEIDRAQFTETDRIATNTFVDQMIERELAALKSRRAYLKNERQIIERQIDSKQADIDAADAERPALQRQLDAARNELETLSQLFKRGLTERPRLVEAQKEEASLDFQLSSLSGRKAIIEKEIEELRQRLEEVGLNEATASRDRMTEIDAEVQKLREQTVRFLRRVTATEVRSPVAGFVQTIPDTVVGRVIEAGGLVAEIVPRGVGLRFAAQLNPRDVSFVSIGQPVNLKIDSFDFSRFGALSGTITEVSPTTIVDQRGVAYYEVLVDIPQPYFRDDPARFALLPGMTGEADILTGKKTVFEYVWKPIYTNLDLALTER